MYCKYPIVVHLTNIGAVNLQRAIKRPAYFTMASLSWIGSLCNEEILIADRCSIVKSHPPTTSVEPRRFFFLRRVLITRQGAWAECFCVSERSFHSINDRWILSTEEASEHRLLTSSNPPGVQVISKVTRHTPASLDATYLPMSLVMRAVHETCNKKEPPMYSPYILMRTQTSASPILPETR